MNRREFVNLAVGGAAIIPAVGSMSVKYGRMTPVRCQHLRERGVDLRAFLNGVDVTADCREADDVEGWALLLKRNERGQHYVDYLNPHEVAQETVRGIVEFRRR